MDDKETLLKKASQGDAKSQFSVGQAYYYGDEGYPQDSAKARTYYEMVLNNTTAPKDTTSMAQYCIAFYYDPRNGNENVDKFAYWLEQAATNGLDEAALALAELHTKAYYPGASEAEHVRWLKHLVHVHNHPSSMVKLGAYLCTKQSNHKEGFALIAEGIAAAEVEGAAPLTYSDYFDISDAYHKHIWQAGSNAVESARLSTLCARKGYEMAMAHTPPLDDEMLFVYKKILEAAEKLG